MRKDIREADDGSSFSSIEGVERLNAADQRCLTLCRRMGMTVCVHCCLKASQLRVAVGSVLMFTK